jgi:Brp/Blh family beta-carotene 15,15'-monooxygenase
LPRAPPFMSVLAAGMVFLGFPHGALDIFILRKVVTTRFCLSRAVALYSLAVAPMFVLWWLFPEATFLFFVIFSAAHFAHSDMSEAICGRGWLTRSKIELFSRLLIPICLPLAFNTERSLELVRQITSTQTIVDLLPLIRGAAILAVASSLSLAALETVNYLLRRSSWRIVAIEPAVICVLFILLDPLYAFGIYFSFMHAVKHMVNVFNSNISVDFYELLPYWIIPVCAVGVMTWLGATRSIDASSELFRWAIIVVSAVAMPHTALISWCKFREVIRS